MNYFPLAALILHRPKTSRRSPMSSGICSSRTTPLIQHGMTCNQMLSSCGPPSSYVFDLAKNPTFLNESDMPRYRVAHIREQGIDLIIIPLASDFGSKITT